MAQYKINTQKLVLFIYTNGNSEKKQIKESILFKILSNDIKHIDFNLAREMKNHQKIKTLKKFKKTMGHEKASHAHGLEKSMLAKRLSYLNYYVDSIATPIQIQAKYFFKNLEQYIIKVV